MTLSLKALRLSMNNAFKLCQNFSVLPSQMKNVFLKYAPVSLIILSSSLLFIFNQYYLTKLTQQLASSFQAQHYRELQTGDTYGLTMKLSSLSQELQWKCILAKKDGVTIFEQNEDKSCGNGIWQRSFRVQAVGLPSLFIDFTIALPFAMKASTLSVFFLQVLLLIFLMWISRRAELEKHVSNLKIAYLTNQIIHDIAGPLHSINVARDYLIKMKTDDPYFADHLKLLELGSNRLNGVASDLLDKNKNAASQKESFFLHDVIQQLENEYRLQCKDLQLTTQLHENSMELHGPQMNLQRALGNIIKNAVEAMQGKGEIVITANQRASDILISITDNGPGMSEATLEKILHGGHSEGKSNGHGIGMKVVRETVEEFGGTLSATSQLGKGTKFSITLPLVLS